MGEITHPLYPDYNEMFLFVSLQATSKGTAQLEPGCGINMLDGNPASGLNCANNPIERSLPRPNMEEEISHQEITHLPEIGYLLSG